MKTFFLIAFSLIFIGAGFFLYNVKKEHRNGGGTPPEISLAPLTIEGWPDGVFESPALKEAPKELKVKMDTSEWETYEYAKEKFAFKYPVEQEGFVLNLKPRVMEENSAGRWYNMEDVFWAVTLRLVENIRSDAEGFFVISVFIKDGEFENVVQKVREFMASGKTFTSERKVKVGELEGIRVSAANGDKTEISTAFILHKEGASKNFIIDVVSKRTQDPEESVEDFAERVLREEKFLDAVVSTFSLL